MGIAYRKEVDGLRAIAVLPVVLFHAGFSEVSGGYIGVDVFFVISGFLITSIILSEQSAGTFTVLGFYERRARRILPALFTVMSVSILLAWPSMPPDAFKTFGESVAAVAVFGSNILFWSASGYFAPAAETMPLLHTWSLAVEEQYYLLFPLFLILFAFLSRNRLALLIGSIGLVSLALAEWGWRYAPDANFYLLSSRAWELLVGSALAVVASHQNIKKHLGLAARNLLSLAGIALIFYAIFMFDEATPIPSVHTIIPVFGTVLILAAGTSDTLVGKILASTPFVFCGLISYSVYLWHQPLFSFAKAFSVTPPGDVIMIFLIALTFVLVSNLEICRTAF